jgi:hypothetical protein
MTTVTPKHRLVPIRIYSTGILVLLSMALSFACYPTVYAQNRTVITLTDGHITPNQLSASTTAPLRLRVVNHGTKPHNLVMPDFYIFTQNLKPGEDVTISFTPDKKGKYPYYSDTGGKPEAGMEGTLIVR